MAYALSNHALSRIRQRGLKEADVDLVLRYGTDARDGVILRQQDAQRRIAEIKREMTALSRLTGTFVVTKANHVITAYRPSKKKRREQLQ